MTAPLPYTNAVLTSINAQGTVPDYDTPGSPGATKWSGKIAITCKDEILQVAVGQAVNELLRTRVTVPYTVGVLIKRGDSLTYTKAGTTSVRIAQNIIMAAETERVRITLQDA